MTLNEHPEDFEPAGRANGVNQPPGKVHPDQKRCSCLVADALHTLLHTSAVGFDVDPVYEHNGEYFSKYFFVDSELKVLSLNHVYLI